MTKKMFVTGMHCVSCELILKERIQEKGFCVVSVNHVDGTLVFDHDITPDEEATVERIIYGLGYGTKTGPHHNGSGQPISKKILVLGIATIMFILLQQTKTFGGLSFTEDMSRGVAFLMGLVASVSTCLVITGGIVMGYAESVETKKPRLTQLLFHAGRLTVFVLGGYILGSLGSILHIHLGFTILLQIVVGVVLGYIGLHILGFIPHITRWGFHLPPFAYSLIRAWKHPKYASIVGGLTFFLPCGFTQAMQLFALQTGSGLYGALSMGLFALGTLPVLFGLGIGTQYIKKRLQSLNMFIASFLVVFGLFTVFQGIQLYQASKESPSPLSFQTDDMRGIRIVEVSHNGRSFIPQTIRLSQGGSYLIRVTPEANGRGCMYSLLYGGTEYMIKKDESFDLYVDATTVRNIPLVCASMGMRQGVIIIE